MRNLVVALLVMIRIAGTSASPAFGMSSNSCGRDGDLPPQTNAAEGHDYTAQLQARARKLRAAIDAVYEDPGAGVAVPNAPSGLDISATIRTYIPPGSPLRDAEAILRFAGFKISKSSPPNTPPSSPTVQMNALIQPYKRGFLWAYASSVSVTVQTGVGENQTVREISGKIVKPAL